jgi:hypothetical protein
LKKIDQEIRVSPIALFKNYEVVKHVSKAISEKSLRTDAAEMKEKALADGKTKIKGEEVALLENETSEEIAKLNMEADTALKTYVDKHIGEAEEGIEMDLEETVDDIMADLHILEDL